MTEVSVKLLPTQKVEISLDRLTAHNMAIALHLLDDSPQAFMDQGLWTLMKALDRELLAEAQPPELSNRRLTDQVHALAHDVRCEADFITEARQWTACLCEERRSGGSKKPKQPQDVLADDLNPNAQA